MVEKGMARRAMKRKSAPRGHLAGGIDEAEECGEDETCEGVSSAGIGSRGDVFG